MSETLRRIHSTSRRDFLQQTAGLAVGAGLTIGLPAIQAAPTPSAEIDSTRLQEVIDFLEREREAGSYPGAAIVASQHGQIFFEHYTGTYCSLSGEVKPYQRDVQSLFFSYSKGISATVIMQAHQEGLIDIDATVASYLPAFAAHGKEGITIRQILTHSAGIPSVPTPFKPLRNDQEWNAAVETACQAQLEWEPGSRTGYHALAMMIPAAIVRERCGRQTWGAICREWLLDPIAATSLTFDLPEDPARVSIAPSGAPGQDAVYENRRGHPAGGCLGTLADGLRVLQLHLRQGVWEGRSLLRPETYAEMHRVQYVREIAAALARGDRPAHETWAVGWLLRGEIPDGGGCGWFGFRDQTDPQIFGHAGIDTVIGVANPTTGVAFMFNTTRSPQSPAEAVRLRNEATNRVFAAVRASS